VLHGLVEIGQGLSLDALGSIHEEQHAVAGGKSARHFIGEIHVTGRVDEIEGEAVAALAHIREGDGVAFDVILFPLKVHGIEI